ncbi:MAG: hypothetical protein ACJ789_03045 [Thermomicrobiales bacterium]
MKPQKFAGLGILLAVTLIISGIKLRTDPTPSGRNSDIAVNGIITIGKTSFLHDPEVKRILKDKYGITVNIDKEIPSNEMVGVCVDRREELDFCWTSSENAGEQIKQRVSPPPVGSATIFNSPIVLYTWGPIADALITQGIVEKTGETYYVIDFPKLIQIISAGTPWSSIGLPQLYGDIKIYSTNPATSNTGNSFAALLANTLNGGQVVDDASVKAVIPKVRMIFNRMGLLQETTLTLFEQFLTLGMGACPIIVAYESYLIEFNVQHQTPQSQQYVRDNVRTLYPAPTVWTTQPMIAFTAGGKRLMEALRDPEIQSIGWKLHGFRPGVAGLPIDPNVVNLPNVPATFDSIIHMPKPAVVDQIIQGLEATPEAAIKPE